MTEANKAVNLLRENGVLIGTTVTLIGPVLTLF